MWCNSDINWIPWYRNTKMTKCELNSDVGRNRRRLELPERNYCVRREISTFRDNNIARRPQSVVAKIQFFLDVTPCRLVKSYRCFERSRRLHLQGQTYLDCFVVRMQHYGNLEYNRLNAAANRMFIGPCIIVIVEELKTNLMSLVIFISLIICSTCFGH